MNSNKLSDSKQNPDFERFNSAVEPLESTALRTSPSTATSSSNYRDDAVSGDTPRRASDAHSEPNCSLRPRKPQQAKGKQTSQVGPDYPSLPAMPRQLMASAHAISGGAFVAQADLLDAAYRLADTAPYGLLGTTRLLRSEHARKLHAHYGLNMLLAAFDAILSQGRAPGDAGGLSQAMLDGLGSYAQNIADCAEFADMLAINVGGVGGDPGMGLLIAQLASAAGAGGHDDLLARQLLLVFQETIEKRLHTVMRDERAFDRTQPEGKAYGSLVAGLKLLANAVLSQRKSLRFGQLRQEIKLAPPLAPRRAPDAPVIWQKEPAPTTVPTQRALLPFDVFCQAMSGKNSMAYMSAYYRWVEFWRRPPGNEPAPYMDQTLSEGLLDVLVRKLEQDQALTASERRFYLQQSFALPAGSADEAAKKAVYLWALAREDVKLGTERSLQEGRRCLDQALLVMLAFSKDGATPHFLRHLGRCYEQRGLAALKLAGRMAVVVGAEHGKRFARDQRNTAYRDFSAALTLLPHGEESQPFNYVAGLERTKAMAAETALAELKGLCDVDEDLADAHYQAFWRHIEAYELDRVERLNGGDRPFKGTTRAELEAKAKRVEEALSAFRAAELTSLYQHQLNEGVGLVKIDEARARMGLEANDRWVRLRLVACNLYVKAGGRANLSCALLHLCHAAKRNDWLMQQHMEAPKSAATKQEKDLQRRAIKKLRRRGFDLSCRKAALYKELRLWRSHAQELQTALLLAKELGWAKKMARLQLALGMAYLAQGRVDEAKTYFEAAAQSTAARPAVARKSCDRLNAIARGAVPALAGDRSRVELRVLVDFHGSHVIAECLQVLANNEKACGSLRGAIWHNFVSELASASSIKAWCETLLGHVDLSDQVTPEQIGRLLALSDLEALFADPALLRDMQANLVSALDHFCELKRKDHDSWIVARDAAQARLRAMDAFYTTTQALTKLLKEGARIRPGSASRQELEALARLLSEPPQVQEADFHERLTKLLGQPEPEALAFMAAHREASYDALRDIMEAALATGAQLMVERRPAITPGGQAADVLVVSGRTLFMSQNKQRIENALAADPNIRVVQVVAENLYIDTDLILPGADLALGAEYIEWLQAVDGKTGQLTGIIIDLSGRDGADASQQLLAAAASGATAGAAGQNGLHGADGAGGEPGGDLIVHATQTCVGLTGDQVVAIKLGGGTGGAGGHGQDGGHGCAGAPGRSGEEKDHHLYGGWSLVPNLDVFLGDAGGAAGAAGFGGAPGLAGEGGRTGELHLQGAAVAQTEGILRDVVQSAVGGRRHDGRPGQGGKGALGGEDGLDYVRMKRNIFHGTKHKRGHGLIRTPGQDPRREESWVATYPDGKQTALQRASHDRDGQHLTRDEAMRSQQHKRAVDLDGLNGRLHQHLAQSAFDTQRSGFADIEGLRADAEAATALFAVSGVEMTTAFNDLESLKASTAAVIAQTQQRAETTQSRMVAAANVRSGHQPLNVQAVQQATDVAAAAHDGRIDEAAHRLHAQARTAIAQKISIKQQDLRIRRALRRAFAVDRLMRRVLAHDAGLRVEGTWSGREPAWLQSRLHEKALRLLTVDPLNESVRAHFCNLVGSMVDALRIEAPLWGAKDARDIAAQTRKYSQRLAAQIASEQAYLVDCMRQMDALLLPVCVQLAAADEPQFIDWAAMTLDDLVKFLLATRDVPYAQPIVAADRVTRPAVGAASQEAGEALRQRLWAKLSTKVLAPRLLLHLERQFESLRAVITASPPAHRDRMADALAAVYSDALDGLDDELRPLAGDMVLAMLALEDKPLQKLCATFGVVARKADEDPVVYLLGQIVANEDMANLRGRIQRYPLKESEHPAGPGTPLATFCDSAQDLLAARLFQATVQALAAHGGYAAPEPDELGQGQALAAARPLVRTWFCFEDLVPTIDFFALATAGGAKTVLQAVIDKSALPPLDPTDTGALIAYAEGQETALTEALRAVLFLLLTGEADSAVVARGQALVQRLIHSDACQQAERPLLELAYEGFTSRLLDMEWELAERWQQALTKIQHKLGVASQMEALQDAVPVAHLAHVVHTIDDRARHLAADARAEMLERAMTAFNSGILGLEAALTPISQALLVRVGRVDAADGWAQDEAARYNAALERTGQEPVGTEGDAASTAAGLFVELISSLPLPKLAVKAAVAERLHLALTVALQELPFTLAQQIAIYAQAHRLRAALPYFGECLQALQATWAARLKAIEQAQTAKEAKLRQTLLQAQQGFTSKLADLVTSTDEPEGEALVAEAALFVALLDQHFDAAQGDDEATARTALYATVSDRCLLLLGKNLSGNKVRVGLTAYMQQILREQVAPLAKPLVAHFDAVLAEIRSPDGTQLDLHSVDEAVAHLDALSWRGVLPYNAVDADCVVQRLLAHLAKVAPNLRPNAAPAASAYAKLAQCLKRKFAAHLVHDDTFSSREAHRALFEQRRQARVGAFKKVIHWLAAPDRTPAELQKLITFEAELKTLCEAPQGAAPRLPTPAPSASVVVQAPAEGGFDPWLAQMMAQQSALVAADVHAVILPACRRYVASCTEDPSDVSHADAVRLAALSTLVRDLLEPHTSRTLGTELTSALKALRGDVAALQTVMMAHSQAAALARRRRIHGLVDRALVAWPALHPLRSQLETILAWPGNKRAAADAFLKAQSSSAQHAEDLQVVLELESALQTAVARLGDEAFLALADGVQALLKHKGAVLPPEAHTQLWLALSECPTPADMPNLLDATLPENWATVLRQTQCRAAMACALDMALSAAARAVPGSLTVADLDRHCEAMVEDQAARYAAGMHQWEGWLTDLRRTPHLAAHHRPHVLAMMAHKIEAFGADTVPFPDQDFAAFADALRDPAVLALINRELNVGHSLIVEGLWDPSFELNKHVLLHAWIVAKLGPYLHGLVPAEQNRLASLLSALAATRQKAVMQKVVHALVAGGPLTLGAVDAVAGFVDRSLELDDTALDLLSHRAQRATWSMELATHTRQQRDHLRSAEELVALMVCEKEGINHSVAHWLTAEAGTISRLEAALNAVREALKRPAMAGGAAIETWHAADVRAWAEHRSTLPEGGWHYVNRGAQLWQEPARAQEAMAVLCQSIKLMHGFVPRDTQLSAMWLLMSDAGATKKTGKLAQLATGEGKSVIIAGVAILQALGGLSVDVITTSKVLAERDAAEHADLFAMFGLSVANICDDACTFGQDGLTPEQVLRGRYIAGHGPVNILYGEAGDFERDQLLATFHQHEPDKQVIPQARQNKANRCALVDEVDGLLLDNVSMVLYLSHEAESLRLFEQLFVRIWGLSNSLAASDAPDDQPVAEICRVLSGQIEAGEVRLPGYGVPNAPYMEIQGMVARRLNGWVQSALHAQRLRLNHEYIVVDGTRPAVVVVDKGTGVEHANVKWSHGLHQFLQLKHGLEVHAESLKAVFLSNLFFFQEYKHNLFGLSGTLGSEVEQESLTKLFELDLFKVPRAHGERFVHKSAKVVANGAAWYDAIAAEATAQRDQGRATLIVCDTIEDVTLLAGHLKSAFPALHTYTSVQKPLVFLDTAVPRPVSPGDLIIATNLAGRGTDLKTSEALERAGGLHVIVSYLPLNVRVQEQAFGRTARGRNQGTGQFILRDQAQRPIHELCRLRDLAEGQRLERALQRDVARIKLEHGLLMGLNHEGNALGGFAALLRDVAARFQATGEPNYYGRAQIDSLKNRWAFWLDSVGKKVDLVHITGPQPVLAAYQEFERGVDADLARGWEGLIVEPAEWLKLGGCYRRDQRWQEAERCYAHAALDPEYAVAGYYQAACRLVAEPTDSPDSKKAARKATKQAIGSVEHKLAMFQDCAQQVSQLTEQHRQRGDQDFGNLYSQRAKEKLQIWHIFLSSMRGALGEELTPQDLKKSAFIEDAEHAERVIGALVDSGLCKPQRISRQFEVRDGALMLHGEPISGLRRYAPVTAQLAKVLRPGGAVTPSALNAACAGLMTLPLARQALNGTARISTRLRLKTIPAFWPGWHGTGWDSATQFALSEHFERLRNARVADETLKGFKQRLLAALTGPPGAAAPAEFAGAAFVERLVAQGLVVEDDWLDFGEWVDQGPSDHDTYAQAREALAARLQGLDPTLIEAVSAALLERRADSSAVEGADDEDGIVRAAAYGPQRGIYLSALTVFPSGEEAGKDLWDVLATHGAIKAPRLRLPTDQDLAAHQKAMRATLRDACGLDKNQLNEAVDSVFAIIEPTIGMLRTLDDKKLTAKFADISKAFFTDHAQTVPPGLRAFVESGLDVVADLVEKKDPPAWYDITAIIVIGMAQIVAGTLVKELLPVAGEFLGNGLINTGIDDITFGVSSAIRQEFDWDGYWQAKKGSLVSALKNAAIVSVASAASSVVRHGPSMAWQQQKLTHVSTLRRMGQVNHASFNIVSHIGREVGRSLVSSSIAQVASRGIQSVVQEISGNFESGIERSVQKAVADRWQAVEAQARALYDKVQGDPSALGVVQECVQQGLKRASREQVFSSILRTSKPAISRAASNVRDGGWASVMAYGGDLAHLGISMARMTSLVDTETAHLARAIREAKDRKAEASLQKPTDGNDALNTALGAQKEKFTAGLVAVINSLLNASVYSPLVSMGAQFASSNVVAALLPQSEAEQWASSSDKIAELLDQQIDTNSAFHDGLFRQWRGGGSELDLTSLSGEQLANLSYEAVEGTDESVDHLRMFYGDKVTFYRDGQGHLYAQRPAVDGYADGIEAGKPTSDFEHLEMAKLYGRDITLNNLVTGEVVTFHANGKTSATRPDGAVRLNLMPGQNGGLGHISPAGASGSEPASDFLSNDCFYAAFLQESGLSARADVATVRHALAEHLRIDEQARINYHNWSLRGGVKKFSGHYLIVAPLIGAGIGGGIELIARWDEPDKLKLSAHVFKSAIQGAIYTLAPNPYGIAAATVWPRFSNYMIDGTSPLEHLERMPQDAILGWGVGRVANSFSRWYALHRVFGAEKKLQLTKHKGQFSHPASSSFQHSQYKAELRNANSPVVKDKKLKELMRNYWRYEDKTLFRRVFDEVLQPSGKVGNGSTADAIWFEFETGMSVKGKWHAHKGQGIVNSLKRRYNLKDLATNDQEDFMHTHDYLKNKMRKND